MPALRCKDCRWLSFERPGQPHTCCNPKSIMYNRTVLKGDTCREAIPPTERETDTKRRLQAMVLAFST